MTADTSWPANSDSVAADQLKSIVERVERLHEERKTIGDDIADVYAEAKANGFNVAVLKKLIADRRKDADERSEFETILELYRDALGMNVATHVQVREVRS